MVDIARIPPFYPGPAAAQTPDYGSEVGASRLAEIIMAKWRAAGHGNVYAWCVRLPQHGPHGSQADKMRFAVRTNLVRGLPPREGRAA